MYDILKSFLKKEGVKMVSDKIKALLSMKGKKYNELATLFGISPQAMRNKFVRGSFSADELIMIADFLNCQLAFEVDNEQKIFLTTEDIRKSKLSTNSGNDSATLDPADQPGQ